MDIKRIVIPTPYAVGDVNAFLVKGDVLTLFDVGPKTEEAYEALEHGLKQSGYRFEDVEQVVLTHHHPDHAGWTDAFTNAALLAHPYVDHWIRMTEDFQAYRTKFYEDELKSQGILEPYHSYILRVREELEKIGSRPLTNTIDHLQEVPGHPGLKAYYTPGHAQSHFIFVDEQTNEAIGGDLLLNKVSSNPLVEPPIDLTFTRPKSLLQYNQSLKFLQTLNLSTIYTGHGEVVINSKELVNERLEKQKNRALKVLGMLEEPKTTFEATMALFPKVYSKEPGLTVSETLGQLDYLVDEQLATVEEREGVLYYQKA
jgi:glyoxylase-like metal-dependent hydrolase (beta-lactamase superfamily II)